MHSPFRLAENMASPGTAHRLAWVVWGICASLILSATVIWILDGGNPLQYVISRTLIYLLLSALLVLTYLVLVFGLQFVLQGITRNSPVPIVVSTLVVALLFQPLRKRIQAFIDRRFYRRKYNAERVLTSFGATLQSELDLAQLSEQLLAVVQETMQPAHISLWLRESDLKSKRHSTM